MPKAQAVNYSLTQFPDFVKAKERRDRAVERVKEIEQRIIEINKALADHKEKNKALSKRAQAYLDGKDEGQRLESLETELDRLNEEADVIKAAGVMAQEELDGIVAVCSRQICEKVLPVYRDGLKRLHGRILEAREVAQELLEIKQNLAREGVRDGIKNCPFPKIDLLTDFQRREEMFKNMVKENGINL